MPPRPHSHEAISRAAAALPTWGCAVAVVSSVVAWRQHRRLLSQAGQDAAATEARSRELIAALEIERDRVTAANLALSHQANHDPLTGVANRVRFLEELTSALARARRSGELVGVLFVDLDAFKEINDECGHATGDMVLVETARRLRAMVRATDVVARQGGDEFTILLINPTDLAAALSVAEAVREALAEPFDIGGATLAVTASVGLALNDDLDTDPDSLMRHADIALYRAKGSGRNRAEVLDSRLRAEMDLHHEQEADLRRGLASGEIVPWFQPVVDMRTGEVVGAEALARWVHPHRGLLMPVAFLPLVAAHGLEAALAETIASSTVALLERLTVAAPSGPQGRPLIAPGFQISMNVDGSRLDLGALVDRFESMFLEGRPVDHLGIEITENAVIRSPSTAAVALQRARALGMRVGLDDFGTGYSSLSLVRDLPLDVIKLDRRFVRGMAHNRGDAAVVAAVIELTRVLGVTVVAEGVEDEATAHALVGLGCRLAQGFHYLQAVPADELIPFLTGASTMPVLPDVRADALMAGPVGPAISARTAPSPAR